MCAHITYVITLKVTNHQIINDLDFTFQYHQGQLVLGQVKVYIHDLLCVS